MGCALLVAAIVAYQVASGPQQPAGLLIAAVVAGFVAFVAWKAAGEERLRRRLTKEGAWGTPATPKGAVTTGVLLVNREGLAWAPSVGTPVLVGWDDIASVALTIPTLNGPCQLLQRLLPFLALAQLDVTTTDGANAVFMVSIAGARSLEEASSQLPPLHAALYGAPATSPSTFGDRSPGSSLQVLVAEVTRARFAGRDGIRLGWLFPATLLTAVAVVLGELRDAGRVPSEGPLEVVFGVALVAAGLFVAAALYPWIVDVTRRGWRGGTRAGRSACTWWCALCSRPRWPWGAPRGSSCGSPSPSREQGRPSPR